MIVKTFMTTKIILLKLISYSFVFMVMTGCMVPKAAPPPKSSARQHVDARAQQQYYDLGLQQYTKENYGEAKEAFEQVIELGPNSALGLKAQENLKKIHRILKTLEEIESK
jgi:outer membrane protein assembly factor BamD (BamD/ComL family)